MSVTNDVRVSDMRHVYTDASWEDGYAGIAVVGALGTHSRVIRTRSSTDAEKEALRWAFALARCNDAGRGRLVFCTDCKTAARAFTAPEVRGWRTSLVPRELNVAAHDVARLALRASRASQAGTSAELSQVACDSGPEVSGATNTP